MIDDLLRHARLLEAEVAPTDGARRARHVAARRRTKVGAALGVVVLLGVATAALTHHAAQPAHRESVLAGGPSQAQSPRTIPTTVTSAIVAHPAAGRASNDSVIVRIGAAQAQALAGEVNGLPPSSGTPNPCDDAGTDLRQVELQVPGQRWVVKEDRGCGLVDVITAGHVYGTLGDPPHLQQLIDAALFYGDRSPMEVQLPSVLDAARTATVLTTCRDGATAQSSTLPLRATVGGYAQDALGTTAWIIGPDGQYLCQLTATGAFDTGRSTELWWPAFDSLDAHLGVVDTESGEINVALSKAGVPQPSVATLIVRASADVDHVTIEDPGSPTLTIPVEHGAFVARRDLAKPDGNAFLYATITAYDKAGVVIETSRLDRGQDSYRVRTEQCPAGPCPITAWP